MTFPSKSFCCLAKSFCDRCKFWASVSIVCSCSIHPLTSCAILARKIKIIRVTCLFNVVQCINLCLKVSGLRLMHCNRFLLFKRASRHTRNRPFDPFWRLNNPRTRPCNCCINNFDLSIESFLTLGVNILLCIGFQDKSIPCVS